MVLTNAACGIWMSKHKKQRPPERWADKPGERRAPEKKRPTQRPSRPKKQANSEFPVPTSEAYFPQSDANFPMSEFHNVQRDGASPDVVNGSQHPQEQPRERSISAHPTKRLSAMTSDAAPDALRRAIQSSPARWQGTRHSPIDVEEQDLGETRRQLFPSPRKDGSPKELGQPGEVVMQVVQIATTDVRHLKEQVTEFAGKENCRPAEEGSTGYADARSNPGVEVLARPTTPIQKTPPKNMFKTPTMPSSHKIVTRSASRSVQSHGRVARSPGQRLDVPTPSRSSALRRSPRHQNQQPSPYTQELNRMLFGHDQSPSRNGNSNGMDLDFDNLPPMPVGGHYDQNISLEDFFNNSTDVPMPSSPPRSFQPYQHHHDMSDMDWDDLNKFDLATFGLNDEVAVKKEQEESPQKTSEVEVRSVKS